MSEKPNDATAFVDVDTQHDFMAPSGVLYVKDARTIAGKVRRLVAHAAEHGIRLFSTTDAHTPDDPEMKSFGPHCMVGTPGQKKIRGTLLPDRAVVAVEPRLSPEQIQDALRHQQLIIEKRAYDPFTNPNTEAVVRASGARHFVVFGVATDYCVRAAALGLARLGYGVTVVEDAIKGIDPEATQRTLDEFRQAGARFTTTDEITG